MKVTLLTFCLMGVVFSNPISYNVILETSELDANTTESLSLSQSSENDNSQHQSSEETTSDQSSESESLETTSEDTTSEESNSHSDEDDQITHDLVSETRDNSMGSEENVRKNLVPVFASVVRALSAEEDNSTEVKGQSDVSKELTETQPALTAFKKETKTPRGRTNLQLAAGSHDTTSESADTSDVTAAASDSDESTSSESDETGEESESTEDSDAGDSAELARLTAGECVNGTRSCESEEDFFRHIGDDAHNSVDTLMAPDEDDRELSLRRR